MKQQSDDGSSASRVVVIGGGISGLTAAYRLTTEAKRRNAKLEVLLCEGGARLGGTINTHFLENIILELGPDMFTTEKPAGLQLCRELGIEDRLISTDEQHRRTFVARNGQLYPLPEGFMMMAPTEFKPLFASELFTWPGKLRMMQEMIVPRSSPDDDESLAQFVRRRLGKEALDRVVQPLVGGIFTSDPEKLSVKAALPRIAQLEQQYGSLIKGLMATRNKGHAESGARYGMFVTFDRGMSVLVKTLASKLDPDSVQTHALVSRVHLAREGKRFRVQFSDGSLLPADAVVVATPAFRAADMLSDLDKPMSDQLRSIRYSSAAVVNLLYRRADVPHPLDGFGFVVPRTERRTIIACSFTSVKWPGRVPENKVLLRAFIGGETRPHDYEMTDEQVECLLWEDLNAYLGIKTVPLVSVTSRFPRSMPQYNVGHLQLIERIEAGVANIQGLELAGNAYHGVGIPDCIASGERAAARILTGLPSLISS
jgi:oxygen-dependent protoporphyrinogen oxidase